MVVKDLIAQLRKLPQYVEVKVERVYEGEDMPNVKVWYKVMEARGNRGDQVVLIRAGEENAIQWRA